MGSALLTSSLAFTTPFAMNPPFRTASEEACPDSQSPVFSATPLVSIVTPIYNGETYLRECIESVLSQTYTNWEYIISDNCSTDATVSIAEEYAKQDSRIRVVKHSEFLAIMPNWNRAMRLISPDSMFCKVVHADETLRPNCDEAMVSVALKNDRIGIVGAWRQHGDRVDLDWLSPPDEVFSGREICRRILMGEPDIFGSPSNIMMRSDIVRSRECFYDENDTHADTTACYEILMAHDFGYVHQKLTHTRLHDESVTSRVSLLNTFQAAKYQQLLKFGPGLLQPEDYQLRYKILKNKYYQILVSGFFWKFILSGEPDMRREFISYHKQVLAELGEKPEFHLLFLAVLKRIYKRVRSLLKRS